MSVEQTISAEELAKLFHQYQRTLAPIFECESASTSADWDQARPKQRKLMIATARLVLSDLMTLGKKQEAEPQNQETPSRPYFAKPGQAEWGC
jgi:hypothetical protein